MTDPNGAALIAAEQERHREVEGYTAEHDAQHVDGSLALAACCYAVPPTVRRYQSVYLVAADGSHRQVTVPTLWPWHPDSWKPSDEDRVRELVKAGALIASEIDRLLATEAQG